MRVERYTSVDKFLTDHREFLLQHEAENNLPLGLSMRIQNGWMPANAPFLAAIRDEQGTVGVAVMTSPHALTISALRDASLANQAAEALANYLVSQNITPSGVFSATATTTAFCAAWQAKTGRRPLLSMHERVYTLTEVIPPTPVAGSLKQATIADVEWLAEWLAAFHAEAVPNEPAWDSRAVAERQIATGSAWYWEVDGKPVSSLASSRPTINGICIGAVSTPPQFRSRGYASNAVAALSQHLLDQGFRFCMLFTDLSNPTSNKIYQAVGFKPLCDIDQYRFED
ncbi:GNAT family N-acetyltransferase [Herpetosiphon giganteus]|uniref:GNAT family N-acetyltransferase n=1 Tax=Herpetosiphon giganteus TaxID=2029754 RepID=UPI001958E950|nr:GNAT family N-acetyltransferase [Herpetosiphon giganteus]MBM7844178.1 putative GNAT family acetyltransferase [Herpetosiphon giganteus]